MVGQITYASLLESNVLSRGLKNAELWWIEMDPRMCSREIIPAHSMHSLAKIFDGRGWTEILLRLLLKLSEV
jgi:hypothetical protein